MTQKCFISSMFFFFRFRSCFNLHAFFLVSSSNRTFTKQMIKEKKYIYRIFSIVYCFSDENGKHTRTKHINSRIKRGYDSMPLCYSQNSTQINFRRENDLNSAKQFQISPNRMKIMESTTKTFKMCLGFGSAYT